MTCENLVWFREPGGLGVGGMQTQPMLRSRLESGWEVLVTDCSTRYLRSLCLSGNYVDRSY